MKLLEYLNISLNRKRGYILYLYNEMQMLKYIKTKPIHIFKILNDFFQ